MSTAYFPAPPTELRDKLAQLIFVRIGSNLPPVRTVEEDVQRIEALLARRAIGGFLLFNGRWPETPATLAGLQQSSRYPLLVCADIERGVGQQLRGLPVFPHAMAFDQLGDESEAAVEEFARITAREAVACGIHMAFAPVADVNTDPRNPIIATRAFSDEADRAARLVSAYVRAAESEGMLTCAKHYPGHGHTHQDSHDSLPVVDRSRAELDDCDFVPFKAAMVAGTSAVMTGHVAYPALDDSGTPATLSGPIVTELLRGEMGFTGPVCSDSLLMAGVRDRFSSEGEMALSAIRAGVDLLLDIADVEATVEFLARAVDGGELAESTIDASLGRIWKLKQRAIGCYLPGDSSVAEVTASGATAAAARVARQAITVAGNGGEAEHTIGLPLDAGRHLMCLVVGPLQSYRRPEEHVLEAALRDRFSHVTFAEVLPETEPSQVAAMGRRARQADQLVIAVVVKPAAWHRFGLTDDQHRLLHTCLGERPTILASLGVPYVLDRYPDAATRVCTFSDVPASQQALADLLSGE